MKDVDLCLPEDRLSKLRFLVPHCHLLSGRVQTEISIATTWIGKLQQAAKLQFMADPENLEQKWKFLKEWDLDSNYLALQRLLSKKKKTREYRGFHESDGRICDKS